MKLQNSKLTNIETIKQLSYSFRTFDLDTTEQLLPLIVNFCDFGCKNNYRNHNSYLDLAHQASRLSSIWDKVIAEIKTKDTYSQSLISDSNFEIEKKRHRLNNETNIGFLEFYDKK